MCFFWCIKVLSRSKREIIWKKSFSISRLLEFRDRKELFKKISYHKSLRIYIQPHNMFTHEKNCTYNFLLRVVNSLYTECSYNLDNSHYAICFMQIECKFSGRINRNLSQQKQEEKFSELLLWKQSERDSEGFLFSCV